MGRVEAHNTAADMPSVSHASSPGATLTYARQGCAPNSMSTAATLPHRSIYVMQARRLRKKRKWPHRRYKNFVQHRVREFGVGAASRRRGRRRRVTQNLTNYSGAFSTPFKPYNIIYMTGSPSYAARRPPREIAPYPADLSCARILGGIGGLDTAGSHSRAGRPESCL